jgi:hypothetical protein
VLATISGPGPIHAETSRDGYLRRAGLDRELVDAYRERFRLRAARYVQWISVPLAVAGTTDAVGFLQRFLISWLVVIAIGVPLGYVTGWLPADRLVTFGFAVPIGAALGLLWLHRRLHARPWLGRALVVVVAGWMIVGALLAWGKQRPFVTTREVARTQSVMRYAEAISEAGTPIVILVDDDDDTASFLAARTANIFRAAAKPDRARDIYIFLGRATDFFAGKPTRSTNREFEAISRYTFASVPDDPDRLVIAARPFYRASDAATHPRMHPFVDGIWVSDNVDLVGLYGEDEPRRLSWRPSNPPAISFATIAILLVLTLLGLGYALVSFDDLTTAIATAPAFGAAALTLTAVALDRLGLGLQSVPVTLAASALAGLGGLALLLLMKPMRDRQAPA